MNNVNDIGDVCNNHDVYGICGVHVMSLNSKFGPFVCMYSVATIEIQKCRENC